MPALPYAPHELDRHPDAARIRATIAAEHVQSDDLSDEIYDLEATLCGYQIALGVAVERIQAISAGLASGCLQASAAVTELEALIERLERE